LFRIVIIHSRPVGLQVLSFDYLVFSFYRTNEYYLVLIGVVITGTKVTGVLTGAGIMTGCTTTGVVGAGIMTGFTTTGVVGAGIMTGFTTTGVVGVVVAADAALTNAISASATVVVLIITFFSCVC